MPRKRLISAQELADILSLSVDTIWRYTREKRIPYIELGPRQYRYLAEDVLRALNQGTDVAREETPNYPPAGKYTYEDYAKLQEETGFYYELIDGDILRDHTPTFHHQRLSRRLQRILEEYFAKVDPRGEVFDAPLDVYFDKYTVLQPDLLYLPGDRPAKNNPVDSLPELVVEILSPSSVRQDRVAKLNCYQRARVPHYWIVDPDNCIIEAYELRDQHYVSMVRCFDGTFVHPSFPGLSFDVSAFFARPPEEG